MVIERVTPAVDLGRFPVKRIVGDCLRVGADAFADSHDCIAVRLRYRSPDTSGWQTVVMQAMDDDRWRAELPLPALGTYAFSVIAWIDEFETWRQTFAERIVAGHVRDRDVRDGTVCIHGALARASRDVAGWLDAQARRLESAESLEARAAVGLSDSLQHCMTQLPPPRAVAESHTFEVVVERPRARFGAWYEMFPRSAGRDTTRSATLDEAAARLPDIAAMGFDVVYVPPIHPIGLTDRKGRQGARPARGEDPGSPWAVGSPAGGHFAVEPGLGTLEDFDRFVASAHRLGLETALDLALHCSPDHPYIREHPEWFPRHADGSLQRAVNPPKRYDDICPLAFEGSSWRSVYAEVRRIVEFWIGHGIKIFRVDNPHTKPFGFWKWLLAELRRTQPDVIFLAEAFTRPKAMRQLAKLGFSQSYTYFMWRHTKRELVSYFQELTCPDSREYFRPNLFVNTPDVLPTVLQTGGRAAFESRLILAATLGANYGLYSGFELCENEAIPGTEEYRDSEKFEYRVRDWNRPGNIKPIVTRLNDIRRAHPALQSDDTLRFHETDADQLICYSKRCGETDDVILVAVTLDPERARSATVELPRADWGIAPGADLRVHELLGDTREIWTGSRRTVGIDPASRVASVWHVAPAPRLDGSDRKT